MRDTIHLRDTRLPSLDGWRTLCIILVLGYHCTMVAGFPPGYVPLTRWLFDGNLGVRCFFIISGLLITWLMLREQEMTGSINLRHFYTRRALRILPVYFAFIAVAILLSICTPFRQTPRDWVANLTFTTNFFGSQWTTWHLWSLAVEEQFYLFWPFVLVLVLKMKCDWRLYGTLLFGILLSAAAHRTLEYVTRAQENRSVLLSAFSFFGYWDQFALGCAAAFIMSRRPAWVSLLATRPFLFAAIGLSFFLVPYVARHSLLLGMFTVPFGPLFEALGLAIFILQSIAIPRLPVYRILNHRWIQAIGILSYSIYIWQQIFCTDHLVYGMASVWWLQFPGWLLPTFVVAGFSYYGLERPLINLRRRFRDGVQTDEQTVATTGYADCL